MNVPKYHSYLPPINNPQLLPSPKVMLELWKEHKMSVYLLLFNKTFQQFAQTLLQVWLNDYSLIDPLFLTQWYSFAKSCLFYEYLPRIPKHIQLWNHYDARCLALFATHRWSYRSPFENSTLPKVPMKIKPVENTTEGLIRRWGNLPEFKELPIQLNFSRHRSWAVPWRLLYRGFITAALYPDECFLAYQEWEGWAWISGWVHWATRTMGNSTASIYPEVNPGELRNPCIHQTRLGLAVGWEIMERVMQYRQLSNRSTQDWLMKQFRLCRKVWLSPYLYGSEDFSQRHLNLLYSYTEWVSWLILYPNRVIENSRNSQLYLRTNESGHVSDYMEMGQIYHQLACQDRSTRKIQEEYENLKKPPIQENRSAGIVRMRHVRSRVHESVIEDPLVERAVIKENKEFFDYIPKQGELRHREVRVSDSRERERTLTIRDKGKKEEIIEEEEAEDDDFDWEEMEEWVVRKNISNEKRSEEDFKDELLSG